MYLLHFPVLIKLFHTAHLERHAPLFVLFALAGSILVSLACHVLVEKPLLARLNRVWGTARTQARTAVPAR